MDEYIQVSAKNKDEAIIKASIQLGTSSDQLDIVVVSEGSSGFFGIGSKPAVIKARRKAGTDFAEEDLMESIKNVSVKPEEVKPQPVKAEKEPVKQEKKKEPAKKEPKKEPVKKDDVREPKESLPKEKPAKERAPKERQPKEKPVKAAKPIEPLTDPAEIAEVENRAKEFLQGVFGAMNLNVEIQAKYDAQDGCLGVDFEGDDMGILIGKRGQTLDSLQYLTSLVVNKKKSSYIRVKLDTEDYRRRRKETLENLARGIAYKVKKTRKPVVLEPMNPYERRIIHSALQGNKFVETTSEGEEPYRHVVVKLKK
jgi:spoIIIJ-associated protein